MLNFICCKLLSTLLTTVRLSLSYNRGQKCWEGSTLYLLTTVVKLYNLPKYFCLGL